LRGPERIEAAPGAIGGGTDGVLGRFGKDNLTETGFQLVVSFMIVGLDQNHSLSIPWDETRTPIITPKQ
jgi:hypothetical protein